MAKEVNPDTPIERRPFSRKHVVGIVLAVVLLLVFLWVAWGITPKGGSAKVITINQGTSRQAIANALFDAGLIRSPVHFLLFSYGLHRTIPAGSYTINPELSLFGVMNQLTADKETVLRLTIPEGWRREQIAQLLTEKGGDGQGFLALTKDKEGYLFPDTYFFNPDVTAQTVVTKLQDTFGAKTQNLGLTRDDVILASIVEREAVGNSDRALIAGIYKNRLKIGMKLDADPTVQFARDTNALNSGQTLTKFWQSITVADYQGVTSPYNTYKNTGLPPAPIANPGLASLQAVKNPASTNAYYFFHTSDGTIITSRTLEEHNSNKAKYLK